MATAPPDVSKRARRGAGEIDWAGLRKLVHQGDPINWTASVQYVDALEAAIRQRDRGHLICLLTSGTPIPAPDQLLPLLGAALSVAGNGGAGGKPPKLLTSDQTLVRFTFAMLQRGGKTADEAINAIAEEMGVSTSTVQRAIKRKLTP